MQQSIRFFCVKEAAAASGLSLVELYRLARLGKLPHFYEGPQLRFLSADLQAYLEEAPLQTAKTGGLLQL